MTTTVQEYVDGAQRVRPHAGMPVLCQDGMLGHIERSLPTWQPHRPTHYVVRTSEHGEQPVIVPAQWAASVTPDHVRLRVRKRQVARLARYRQR